MSRTGKWIVAMVFAVAGIVVLVGAIIYVTVPIDQLPGFMPGGHPGGGTYHKRAALTGLIAIVLLAIAIAVGLSARRADAAASDGAVLPPAADDAPGSGLADPVPVADPGAVASEGQTAEPN